MSLIPILNRTTVCMMDCGKEVCSCKPTARVYTPTTICIHDCGKMGCFCKNVKDLRENPLKVK